jgi:hypothetical protein
MQHLDTRFLKEALRNLLQIPGVSNLGKVLRVASN